MEIMKKRHFYIDLFRGFAFSLMVIDHLIFDMAYLFSSLGEKYFPSYHYINKIVDIAIKYRISNLSSVLRLIFVAFIFLFISGLSSHLSRNNQKRGFRLLIIAMMLTFITVIVAIILKDYKIIIYFGVLHCLSICILANNIFKKINKYILLFMSLLIIGFGFYFSKLTVNTIILIPFNLTPNYFSSSDYYPLFPYLGFYILGYIFGDWYFNIKGKPKVTNYYKNNVFTYLGRNTLIWYFLHQVILFILGILFIFINYLIL